MKTFARVLFLSLTLLLIPAAAVAEVGQDAGYGIDDNSNRYSYISVHSIDLELTDKLATYNINYTVDEGVKFLVTILGKNDLKSKIAKILGKEYDDCKFGQVTMDSAKVLISNPSMDNGDGSWWFSKETLAVTVPVITLKTARTDRVYTNTAEIPSQGYFAEAVPEVKQIPVKTVVIAYDTPNDTQNLHYY